MKNVKDIDIQELIKTFPIDPILDRIIVLKDCAEKDASGFHLPDSIKGKSRTGTVIAAGPGRVNTSTGEFIPLVVKAGDRVVLKEYDGYRFDWDGVQMAIFTEAEIIGILKEE